MSVSLGGGHNVFDLVKIIKDKGLDQTTELYSPSELTIRNCQQLGLDVKPISLAKQVDLAFDGCDSVDFQLKALKSGGGIHLFEKIAPQKAKAYYLLAPSEKISQQLDPKIPLCLEIAEPALDQILKLAESLGLDAQVRMAQATATYARSPLGNLLVDLYASSWQDIVAIENKLVKENGVISSSLFANLVTGVISEKNQTGFIFKGE